MQAMKMIPTKEVEKMVLKDGVILPGDFADLMEFFNNIEGSKSISRLPLRIILILIGLVFLTGCFSAFRYRERILKERERNILHAKEKAIFDHRLKEAESFKAQREKLKQMLIDKRNKMAEQHKANINTTILNIKAQQENELQKVKKVVDCMQEKANQQVVILGEITKLNTFLVDKVEELKDSLNNLEEMVQGKESNLRDEKVINENLTRQKSSLNEELKVAMESVIKKEQSRQETENDIVRMNMNIKKISDKNDLLHQEVLEAKAKENVLVNENEMLQENLGNPNDELQSQRGLLQTLRSNCIAKGEELVDLKELIESLIAKTKELRAITKGQEEDKQRMIEENTALSENLQHTKENLTLTQEKHETFRHNIYTSAIRTQKRHKEMSEKYRKEQMSRRQYEIYPEGEDQQETGDQQEGGEDQQEVRRPLMKTILTAVPRKSKGHESL